MGVPEAKTGERVPLESVSDESVLSDERLLVPETELVPAKYEVREVAAVTVAELPGASPVTVSVMFDPEAVPAETTPAVVV